MDEKIFEKFSESARGILISSQQLAESMQTVLGSEHVLLALVMNHGTFAHEILHEYDINADQIKLILSLNQSGQTRVVSGTGLTEDVQQLLLSAFKLAVDYGHASVDAEHMLLAMTSQPQSVGYELIERLGVNPEHLRKQLEDLFSEIAEIGQMVKSQAKTEKKTTKSPTKGKTKTPALDYFTVDLTRQAREGGLDPMIGRAIELERAIQILSRRNKNNPMLVGEPGVGKTAIVEGLAQRIASGKVPTHLLGKRLLTLDLGLLIAGTMYRGQFEERLKKVLDEIKTNNQIILFIDEIHTIIGAGSAEGSLDAANILKPALTQGWIRLIGATTHEEYRKHIKKDEAFARRLQVIQVDEPTNEEAIAILSGLKPHFEQHHQVTIAPEAITAAVELSRRYLTDQFLPDKALDLIDEAAAKLRISTEGKTIQAKLAKKLAQLNQAKEEAVAHENYVLANQLKAKFETLEKELSAQPQTEDRPIITETMIAELIGKITHIPVTNLIASEKIRYRQLHETLKQHIIGQDEAISKVSAAIKRSRIGLTDPNRPIGSFLFLGPTGVGKTELARILAKEVFGSPKALIKIDMSDFMERHNTSRLVGAPAGYVGYDEGGKLTEAIRRQPHSVVLLDEIEKAHPDVFNMLLQVLEDGQLVDAKGLAVNFKNTIIIMTSNLGMAELTRQAVLGFAAQTLDAEAAAKQQYEAVKANVHKTLKEQFRPEFLNRLDHTIIFQPLGKSELHQITAKELEKLQSRIESLGYQVMIEESVIPHIAQLGHDPANGARPLRRAIAEHIEAPLADHLLQKRLKPEEAQLTISLKKDQLRFTTTRRAT